MTDGGRCQGSSLTLSVSVESLAWNRPRSGKWPYGTDPWTPYRVTQRSGPWSTALRPFVGGLSRVRHVGRGRPELEGWEQGPCVHDQGSTGDGRTGVRGPL